ncbi:hypothetical protein FOQG_17266 [Fusarium oxysporum f. sp. raphani 54005]|uniref:Uncharacterized protein n=1 Tax=Fusarium oxysporum f. sp. raphani 54005 TaxID=1089458 RepID=X0B8D4_FUSOX|nr:hypothetical protein FOQG_17266 [Fusarium oxysporum f. sp. raphani 54005]
MCDPPSSSTTRSQSLRTTRRQRIFLPRRTSLAHTFAALASARSPDWNISSDTSAPTPRRNPSSVPNAQDASPAAICSCATGRSCTRPRSPRHVPEIVAALPAASPPARAELARIASYNPTQLHPMHRPLL